MENVTPRTRVTGGGSRGRVGAAGTPLTPLPPICPISPQNTHTHTHTHTHTTDTASFSLNKHVPQNRPPPPWAWPPDGVLAPPLTHRPACLPIVSHTVASVSGSRVTFQRFSTPGLSPPCQVDLCAAATAQHGNWERYESDLTPNLNL